jgi:hypothetical protein
MLNLTEVSWVEIKDGQEDSRTYNIINQIYNYKYIEGIWHSLCCPKTCLQELSLSHSSQVMSKAPTYCRDYGNVPAGLACRISRGQ